MSKLGAKKFRDRSDVDQEDWPVIDKWFAGVLKDLPELGLQIRDDYLWQKVTSGGYQKKDSIDRKNPFHATLVVCSQHKEWSKFNFDN